MTVLVGYVSRRGATRGVAERIAERLREDGLAVHLVALSGNEDATAYQAVVLGSPVYAGRWGPELVHLLRRCAQALRERPVWTFTVGRLDGQGGLLRLLRWPDATDLADLHRLVPVQGHRFLSGVLDPARLTLVERALFRAVGGRYGDPGDRAAVDAWADEIARALRPAAAVSGRSSLTDRPAPAPNLGR
jgi:menaquinone-dependent protoporphyrinogen oxidase